MRHSASMGQQTQNKNEQIFGCDVAFLTRIIKDMSLIGCVTPCNIVCSALFLQRALYTVHCTIIMNSKEPPFVFTHAIFS